MTYEIIISELTEGEEEDMHLLVKKAFDEFIAPDYSQEGIDTFYGFIHPDLISDRIKSGGSFVLSARNAGRIIGIIEISDSAMGDVFRIRLFDVAKDFHGIGVGRKLVNRGIEKCRMINPAMKTLTVNSSPFAVKIYQRLGFVETEGRQMKNGIIYYPMQKDINA